MFSVGGNTQADTEDLALYLCIILDDSSIENCTSDSSCLDSVLATMNELGVFVAVFFDEDHITHNEDYASAMMKVFSYDFPMGTYSENTENIENAKLYQNYIVKSASRLLLMKPTQRNLNNSYYSWNYDVLMIDGHGRIIDYAGSGERIAVRINESTVPAFNDFINEIAVTDYYIITPTQCGEASYGRRQQ